jgi:hypothetical protein
MNNKSDKMSELGSSHNIRTDNIAIMNVEHFNRNVNAMSSIIPIGKAAFRGKWVDTNKPLITGPNVSRERLDGLREM